MDQIALQFDRPKPTELLARLDLTASPVGITRVFFRRGLSGTSEREMGRISLILQQARKELEEYLAGDRTFFTVPVDLSELPRFDRAALDAASQIPYGKVRSYKWIAERLGEPDAARAVGGAMAANPVPLIVPCHRVVRTDGRLGGYTFGLVQKEVLLNLERSIAPYVGCALTKTFCRKGCARERRAPEGGRVHFAAPADATGSGYQACSVCRPA
jgi:methylated-DNA-[protein]-cysteine S-methyltransferase